MQKANNSKLKWVEWVSHLMDEQFRLPGTKFRFGLDPILNLIPVVGDLSGFAVSAALIATMARQGASGKVMALMIFNVAIDTLIGGIPIIGQIFDFAYKANTRNIKLLRAHYVEGKHSGSGKGVITLVLVALFVFFVLIAYASWKLIEWLVSYL